MKRGGSPTWPALTPGRQADPDVVVVVVVRKSCSCYLCVYASRRDTSLSAGRWPRVADLYAEVEQVWARASA
ncbi:hypothetical protein [Streptomyces sp. NPDC005046]